MRRDVRVETSLGVLVLAKYTKPQGKLLEAERLWKNLAKTSTLGSIKKRLQRQEEAKLY